MGNEAGNATTLPDVNAQVIRWKQSTCFVRDGISPAGLSVSSLLCGGDGPASSHAAARGGIEKMHAIHSIIYRVEYREGHYVSDHAAMSLMRPYYKLIRDAGRNGGAG